jgi:hypothetical protein
MYVFGALCLLHSALQGVEDAWFRNVFRFRGDVPNRLTCSAFNTYLVTRSVYTLFVDDWYLYTQTTKSSKVHMVEYFLYDILYMASSPSVRHYIMYIVHHLVSLSIIYMLLAYDCANNLTSNLVIILLEAPTPLVNITRIHDYLHPRNPVYTNVTHAVYGLFRVFFLPIVLCASPWTFDVIHPVMYFVYVLFAMLTVASYKWFMAMTVKPKHAERCMTM